MKSKIIYLITITVSLFYIACNPTTNDVKTSKNPGDSANASAIDYAIKSSKDTTTAKPQAPEVKDQKVSVNDLPATVKPYVEKNFAGYTIKSATHDPLCDGADAFDVVINKPGQTAYSLIFKPDGTFVQKEVDVTFNFVPAKIKETIKSKFPGGEVGKEVEKLTMADNSIQYAMDLKINGKGKEVIITSEGNVVCGN